MSQEGIEDLEEGRPDARRGGVNDCAQHRRDPHSSLALKVESDLVVMDVFKPD